MRKSSLSNMKTALTPKKMKTDPFYPFDPLSEKEWKQKIQADLKGADYNETLVWQSEEGIDVKPFYTGDKNQETRIKTPGTMVGNVRPWMVAMRVEENMESIPKDVDAVVIPVLEGSTLPESAIKAAMEQDCFIHFEMAQLSQESISRITELLGDYMQYALNIDILGHLGRTGNWFHSNKEDHAILQFLMQHARTPLVCSVDMALFQNAGANRIQQLAYALAQANEYLNFGDYHGLRPILVFVVAVDGNYFFEIAKLRALRWLWDSLAAEYGIDLPCHILATPSLRNKSTFDYNSNLLRSTMECMAAIQGGADTVMNRPYDSHFKNPHDFSSRIALNQLRILKHEAYMSQVRNAADGAYYIEQLTVQLADKALKLFKEIDAAGGFFKQLKEGTIQRKIREHAAKQQQIFDAAGTRYVGANAYLNEAEKIKDQLELDPFLDRNPRKTEIEPIIAVRLAEGIEKKRLDDE